MLLMCLEVLTEGVFCFSVRDWEGVCRKLLSLVFLNFQLLTKMLNFIFIEVTWKLGYLRWLNIVQENWLRGHTSYLQWKWLICSSIWCQTFSQKMWVLRFYDSQLLWIIGHSWTPKVRYCMLGKHSVNLSISLGGLNLLPNFKKMEEGRLGMNTIFRWSLLEIYGRDSGWRLGMQFLHKDELKSEIFNENKSLLTKMFSSVNLNSEFSHF